MKHTVQEDNWEREFEDGSFRGYPTKYKVFLVLFIKNLLASQLQSILEEVEKMKEIQKGGESDLEYLMLVQKNQVLNDVQSIISNRMGEKI